MIKLVCFDLDGVLVYSTKELHRKAFKEAVFEVTKFQVHPEIESELEALSTHQKIQILVDRNLINKEDKQEISIVKALKTIKLFQDFKFETNPVIFDILEELKNRGVSRCVCSNSIDKTVALILAKTGLDKYIDRYFSNEHVANPKPDPEIYLTAIKTFRVKPEETLIIEDSINGVEAALAAKTKVIFVRSPNDLDAIRNYI